MPAFLLLFIRFIRGIWSGLKDPEFRSLFYGVLGMLGIGTWFYTKVEGWSILDSLYFSVITLTTVGYGDFSPKHPAGKIFTMIYVLIGLGLISGFVYLLAERTVLFKKSDSEKELNTKDTKGTK